MVPFEEFLGRKIEPLKPVPMSQWPLPTRLFARAWQPGERVVGETLRRCLSNTGERFKEAMKRLAVERGRGQRRSHRNVRFSYQ
jgi:hypothetical protein